MRRRPRVLETVRTQNDITAVRNDWTDWKSGCWFSNMVQHVQLHFDGLGRYKEPLVHLTTAVCHLAHRLGGPWSGATLIRQTSWQNMPTDSCQGEQWPCITWQSKQGTESILCTTQSHTALQHQFGLGISQQAFCCYKKNLQCTVLLPVGMRRRPLQDAPQNTRKNYTKSWQLHKNCKEYISLVQQTETYRRGKHRL